MGHRHRPILDRDDAAEQSRTPRYYKLSFPDLGFSHDLTVLTHLLAVIASPSLSPTTSLTIRQR
jgi:hypothetical protein